MQGPVTPENAGDRLCTRCERETLSRFPKSGAILFTIRTHIRALNTFEGRPDKVPLLCALTCGMSWLHVKRDVVHECAMLSGHLQGWCFMGTRPVVAWNEHGVDIRL